MKKGLFGLVVLLIALLCMGQAVGLAQDVGGTAVSVEVSGELGHEQMSEDGTQAVMGTDAYLYVDPDTASYVTFYVTNEAGRPIPGAQIYITYNGIRELYGVTGQDGKCSMYIFRDVEYEYTVSHTGYESASGSFIVEGETRFIHVILRKQHKLTVIVVNKGTPVPGVKVTIDGEKFITDKNGRVEVVKPSGVYDIIVETDDGRRIPAKAVVRGDTVVVVDIGLDDQMADGGRDGDRFLVYNKLYNPEDYALTEYLFTEADIERGAQETEDEFALRVERYLAENVNTVLVEAQPERTQHDNAPDKDVITPQGEPLYAQRSMMPTGYLLRDWEKGTYSRFAFVNEQAGMLIEQTSLHSGDMMKVWAILHAMTRRDVKMADIVTPETLARKNGLRDAGLTNLSGDVLELKGIDLDAVRPFEFDFDHAQYAQGHESCELLPGTIYTDTLFEFMITPILPQALREMVTNGLRGQLPENFEEIRLANPALFRERLRQWQADGKLTDTECAELYAFVIDGRLGAEEIEALRLKQKNGGLSRDAVEALLDAALTGKVYRMQAFVHYAGVSVNVTKLLDATLLWDADDRFEEELERQHALSIAAQEEAAQEELIRRAEQALPQRIDALYVNNEGSEFGDKEYIAAENSTRLPVSLRNTAVNPEGEFAGVLRAKRFSQWDVDVRYEQMAIPPKPVMGYRAYFEEGITQFPQEADYRFEAEFPGSGLYATAWTQGVKQP